MPEIRDIYQEVILDHGRKPRNLRPMEGTDNRAEGNNPLCGDRITVYVLIEAGRIRDVSFEGSGCAISVASASVMTETVKGLSMEEVERLFDAFHEMITGGGEVPDDLGKLAVFRGVREFPVRVKCATLAWHTLRAALAARGESVTTE